MSSPGASKLTGVAVGIVQNDQGQVLFTQRPAGKPYAGWWEFPGGKIELGETVALALARELREELGIQILECHAWLTQRYVYPHAHVQLQFCHVRGYSGQLQSLEGQAFAWGTVQRPPLPFLPAALPVLKSMQLPTVLHFTAASAAGFELWQAKLAALDHGTVIVAQPESDTVLIQSVLDACLQWKAAQPERRRVIVGSCHPQAWWGLADGVHYTANDLAQLTHRPSHLWVGASASDPELIKQAAKLGCNYLTVDEHSGWGGLGEVLSQCQVAAYARGTFSDQHLPLAQAAGAAGIAVTL